MKLKYRFEEVDMGDQIISVPVGKDSEKIHGVLKMNREGLEIVKLLEEETSEEAIVEQLTAKYENDKSIIESYVHDVIGKLCMAGLIEA